MPSGVFFIFRDAEKYAAAMRNGARKIAGDLGQRMLKLAEGTVTGVMVGIVGTAAAQAIVAMIGYLIAGLSPLIRARYVGASAQQRGRPAPQGPRPGGSHRH